MLLALAAALAVPAVGAAEADVRLRPLDAEGLRGLRQNDGRRVRLIHVWASWCGPCVVEMPDLVALHERFRGRAFEAVTVSADGPARRDQALEVLVQRRATTTNYIFSGGDTPDLVTALDREWSGGLPFTLLVAPGGRLLYRKQGSFDAEKLQALIEEWLAGQAVRAERPARSRTLRASR